MVRAKRITNADGSLHGWGLWCPGCRDVHVVTPGWSFNGDEERPTFAPSILVTYGLSKRTCHSFVRDGRWEFLGDCTHTLAGQTVDVPDFRWDDDDALAAARGTR